MENQIILNIKDSSKLAFFIEVIKNFDFVSINKIITNDKSKNENEFLNEIEQAVKEINLVNSGKLKAKSAKKLLDEL